MAYRLRFEARWRRGEPEPDFAERVVGRSEDKPRLVREPPDFATLAGGPSLQHAVVALHDDARRWFDGVGPP